MDFRQRVHNKYEIKMTIIINFIIIMSFFIYDYYNNYSILITANTATYWYSISRSSYALTAGFECIPNSTQNKIIYTKLDIYDIPLW